MNHLKTLLFRGAELNKKIASGGKHYLIPAFLLYSILLYPQKMSFEKITEANGLSSNDATCIYQDCYGFVWIGTSDGLNRYDGREFKIYTHQKDDDGSISSNRIFEIAEDSDSNLWISTHRGLNRYYRDKDRFENFYHDAADLTAISHNTTRYFYLDEEGNFWLTSKEGLNKIVKTKHGKYVFKRYYPDLKLSNSKKNEYSLFNIVQDKNGFLWMGSWGGGLLKFNPANGEFKHYRRETKEDSSIAPDIVRYVSIDRNNKIWVAIINGGIDVFDPEREAFIDDLNYAYLKSFFKERKDINVLYKTRNNLTWIGTRDGVFIHQPDSMIGVNRSKMFKKVFEGFTRDIYQDKNGITWIATALGDGGVYKLDPQRDKFSRYFISLSRTGNNDYINDFARLGKETWLSTFGDGIVVCDEQGQVKKRYRYPFLSDDFNRVILPSEDGKMWIGSLKGLDILDPEKERIIKSFQATVDSDQSLQHDVVYKILKDDKNFFWVLTQEGISIIDNESLKIVPNEKISNIRIKKIRHIFINNRRQLVITGDKGVAIYDPLADKLNYLSDPVFQEAMVLCGVQQDDGTYWFGTPNGLIRYNASSGRIKIFDENSGLLNSWITDCELVDGQLCFSTKKSVEILDIRKNTIKNYSSDDGLKMESGNLWVDDSGYLHVPYKKGFTKFKPREIKPSPFNAPLFITGFFLEGVEMIPEKNNVLSKSITVTNEIKLDYSPRSMSFKVSALDYSQPGKIKYKYILENYDTAWNTLGKNNTISFVDLPRGKYLLRVKASSHENVWSNNEAVLGIHILPSWWKSWQATVVFILLIGMAIYFYRVSMLKKRSIAPGVNKQMEVNLQEVKQDYTVIPEFDLKSNPKVSKNDKAFLMDVEKVIAENYMNEDFSVGKLASCMHISRVHLTRKLVNSIGISPAEYIRNFRLNKAVELLKSGANITIAEVAYETGFKHPSNFSQIFTKHFHVKPTEFSERLDKTGKM